MAERRTGGRRASVMRKRTNRQHQVFVSHATADKWIATVICEKIDSTGANYYRDDRDIRGGDDIPEEIRKALKKSDELLVLMTPESVDREWIRMEVGAFWGKRKESRIVTVLCHVTVDRIPAILKSKKAISINDLDTYFVDLRQRAGRTMR